MAVYVKYTGIDGDVTIKGFEKWIEVQSFQWGVGRGISSASGAGGSKRESSAPSISEIVVTKTMDVASPLLLKAAIGGGGVKVDICMTRTDNKGTHVTYQKYVLEDTLISGYSISSGGDRPSESISLNFSKFDSEYIAIDSKFGTKSTGHIVYDISKALSG